MQATKVPLGPDKAALLLVHLQQQHSWARRWQLLSATATCYAQ
jgi:hypothetical protein